jgi:hypothetical protein
VCRGERRRVKEGFIGGFLYRQPWLPRRIL